jgi:nucleoside-diphosphate-sugar epimerase
LEEQGAELFKFDIKRNWSNQSMPEFARQIYKDDPMDVTNKELINDVMNIFRPDYVFHLFGIKGNPRKTAKQPIDFMYPMLVGDANMIYLAQKYNVKRFLYTSSIAVENMETDFYPAWAKLTAEHLIEAMRIQYQGTEYCIVRPANVYGRYDDFEKEELMVVSDLIKKGLNSDFIDIWDDGQSERDFINAKDVARGMIKAMEEMPSQPVNLCSGKGTKIIDIANIIGKELNRTIIPGRPKKPTKRVLKLNWDFKPEIDIETGIKEVIKWKKSI